jgi:competence protein ComEA
MNAWQDWQKILFGVLSGLLGAAAILILSSQPQGSTIHLAPIPTEADINVYVVGEVVSPGVYQLPPGSRAYQAIEAAGGLEDTADMSAINLAVQLADGAKINVPALGAPADSNQRSFEISGVLVNINSATLDELLTLPGIGEDKANRIIRYREENGPFSSIEEITKVSGIGATTFEKLKNLITVAP